MRNLVQTVYILGTGYLTTLNVKCRTASSTSLFQLPLNFAADYMNKPGIPAVMLQCIRYST
jgi:hypothetical protein